MLENNNEHYLKKNQSHVLSTLITKSISFDIDSGILRMSMNIFILKKYHTLCYASYHNDQFFGYLLMCMTTNMLNKRLFVAYS